ncbi:MAG: hypothetical protein ACYS8L_01400, partial [Planctomycetota bacterium]
GYGPRLGPLVVAGTAFALEREPKEGILWETLRDAVSRHVRGSDGRLVVNDSKQVYSPALGLKRLEEAVLGFLAARPGGGLAANAGELFAEVSCRRSPLADLSPWFQPAADLRLPLVSNPSAVKSKASVLREALGRAGARLLSVRATLVFAPEFNRIVARTKNKSLLLFQKCGLVLQEFWRRAGAGRSHILVDKHGARKRYRRLLLDVFPGCRCDIRCEEADRSTYSIADPAKADRVLVVTFREGGDQRALPTALASMVAKYLREVCMSAFNLYWQQRLRGLKPTAGYHHDAHRFLRDIAPALHAEGVDLSTLVRRC